MTDFKHDSHRDNNLAGRCGMAGPSITAPSASSTFEQQSQTGGTFSIRKDSVLSIDEPAWDAVQAKTWNFTQTFSRLIPRPTTASDPPAPLEAGLLAQPTHQSSEASRGTEQALSRCFALAAAVTTWCLLQPLIFLYVMGHFKHYHFSTYTSRVVIPLFMLSTLVGIVLGPKAALEVMRITETGEPPTAIRVKVYALVLALTTLMALTPILLLMDFA